MVGSAVATLVGQAVAPLYIFVKAHRVYPVAWPVGRALGAYGVALVLVALGETVLPVRGWAAIGARTLALLSFLPALVLLGVLPMHRLRAVLAGVRAHPVFSRP
jgi:hypothetical protein